MPHLIQYLFKFFCWIIYQIPSPIRDFIGDILGIVWFDIFRIRRKIALDNLNIVFPEKSLSERKKIARKSICNLGRGLMEVFTLPILDRKWLDKNIVFEGLNYFYEAQKQGKGVLLLSLHLGNGDMGASMMSCLGLPIYLITKRFSIGFMDRFWFEIRTKHGTQFIADKKSTFDILRALKKNAGVVFVLDQYTSSPTGIRSQFFGRETGTACGLAIFAEKTQAPVIPVYIVRGADNKNHIIFESEISFESKESHEETVSYMTQKYSGVIEKLIRHYPDQWLWIHRRWKEYR